MVREAYHQELKKLEDEISEMARTVAGTVKASILALKLRDNETAKRIITGDIHINRKRFDIEEKCLLLIATQQPMAGDLRIIAAIMSIATELERIGDYAEGIAKISVSLGNAPLVNRWWTYRGWLKRQCPCWTGASRPSWTGTLKQPG
jgi:phosphate transport system protein